MSTTCSTKAMRGVLPALVLLASGGAAPIHAQEPPATAEAGAAARRTTRAAIEAAGSLAGFEYTDKDVELMLDDVIERLQSFAAMRAIPLPNDVPPAQVFRPLGAPRREEVVEPVLEIELPTGVQRPADLEELAWASIPTLAALVRSQKVSCVELAELSLARLERLDPTLHCVITLTRERALTRARALDAELAAGTWRGMLHGIPFGAKDLLAARGHPTTWGAEPYATQVLDLDAAAIEKLEAKGAVLVAKLSLGALAWGDVWFGGTTRNPWRPEQGSSGSSAGSAAAVAAGCVPFAIGSETLGSIISPSERCGTSSLRPTFGRVSRHGAMALSWSMDKLGPLCRSATDAAVVFAAIQGADPRDPASIAAPFHFPAATKVWRVGYLASARDRTAGYAQVLADLEAIATTSPDFTVELVAVEPPDYPSSAMTMVLQVEAAAAFDQLTRSRGVDLLVRQERFAWPNVFRHAQLVPAVEYVRAERLRTLLMRDWVAFMASIDVIVHPSFADGILAATNLAGNPTVVMPAGFRDNGTPFGVSFTGRPFEDDRVLTLARRWQESTRHHLRHPPL